MRAEEQRQFIEFERKLKVGSQVIAKWHIGHGQYRSLAIVSKVTKHQIKVKLLREVPFKESTARYPIGYELIIPRFMGCHKIRWSQFNRVEPSPNGYQELPNEINV
jgi:hypothetical protein